MANIDWPTERTLTVEQMKGELAAQLDMAAELNMNAVVFQVRPACDAMYDSDLEPWSEFLTGQQGKAPEGGFDPLKWACDEAHKRGIELHAWFNPYRARHPDGKSELAENHVSKTIPDAVVQYGAYQWLDPGDAEAEAHSLAVLLDVVERYDVDAVHFDDYFYPYPINEKNEQGVSVEVPFPDDRSWGKYLEATPEADRMTRNDWRRENVNRFMRRVYEGTHRIKPHVKFGVSPFGIWRPNVPPSIKGFDQYDKLYADARLWLREGWVDYFSPQLYWPIDQRPQSFPVLLNWWAEQNPKNRLIWPGLYTSKVLQDKWPAEEVSYQIKTARGVLGSTGHIHFSIKAIQANAGGLKEELAELYAEPALVPAAPWMAGDTAAPEAPGVMVEGGSMTIKAGAGSQPALWVVQTRAGDDWTTKIDSSSHTEIEVASGAEELAISAVDRFGRKGEATAITLGAETD